MKHTKNLLLLVFMTFMSILFCNANAGTDNQTQRPNNYKPIIVRREPTNLQRSLDAPIFAYSTASTIILDFIEDLGVATVVVQSLTVGGQIVEIVDTGMGNVVIDIDSILTVGHYYMTISTMSGDIYYAEFTLE